MAPFFDERMVMADWMGHLAWWITALAEMIGAHVMGAPAIHADDTPIKVLSPGKGRTATGRRLLKIIDGYGATFEPRQPIKRYKRVG